MAQLLSHAGCQFLITFLWHSVREAWSGSLLFHFSRPYHRCIRGPGPSSTAAAGTRAEGERGETRCKHLEVKAATAAGGQRWMKSTPQDQSGTRSHSRSSFSSSTLVNTTSSLPPTNHITTQPIWHLFCHIYRERRWKKSGEGKMRGKVSWQGSWGGGLWGDVLIVFTVE